MKRIVITLVSFLFLFIILGCSSNITNQGKTFHFSGTGNIFGAGVNTTIGKYEELVIHSIDKSQINNITFELKGKDGIMGTGVFSLDSTGYYMGGTIDLGGDVSKKDTMKITLKWDGNVDTFELKNVDK